MPSPRRSLDLTAVAEASRAMFAGTEPDLFGLEVEWSTHRLDDEAARMTPVEMSALQCLELPGQSRITFEPGGQVELSTLPFASLDETIRAVRVDTARLTDALRRVGFDMTVNAVDGQRQPSRVLDRARYQAMEDFFAHRGACGALMMNNTTSTQVNLSHDQADPVRRWRLLNRMAPVLIAIFANSPGTDHSGREWKSLRQAIWWSIDPGRTRPVRCDLEPAQAWLDYALCADVFFVNEEGSNGARGVSVPPGMSFGSWMQSGHEVGWPTLEDFSYHLSMLFPPIRPRGWLEVRFLDALPTWIREVATATVATLCATRETQRACERLPNTTGLWMDASRNGLDSRILAETASRLMDVVQHHLDEVTAEPGLVASVAEFADRYVRRHRSPGDDLTERPDLRFVSGRSLVDTAH